MARTFRIKKTPGFDKAIIEIKKFPEKMTDAIFEELEDTGIRIRNQMINLMTRTPQTGRRYKKKSGTIHIASSPGRAPAVDTGRLKNSIKVNVRKAQMEVETGSDLRKPPYGVFLEEGTSKMEPRPFLEPAVHTATRNIERRIMRALDRL